MKKIIFLMCLTIMSVAGYTATPTITPTQTINLTPVPTLTPTPTQYLNKEEISKWREILSDIKALLNVRTLNTLTQKTDIEIIATVQVKPVATLNAVKTAIITSKTPIIVKEIIVEEEKVIK